MKRLFYYLLLFILAIDVGWVTADAETVTDVLTYSVFGYSSTTYSVVANKTSASDAVYTAKACRGASGTNYSLQLGYNTSSSKGAYHSGIVTTGSGGKVKSITVSWASAPTTSSGRIINIYGKNSAYTGTDDLFESSTQGSLLGTIVNGTNNSITVSGDYTYVGLYANGAAYLTSITIVWDTGGSTTVAAPTFSPASGSQVYKGTIVTLSQQDNEDIMYQKDVEPDVTQLDGTVYSSPIEINGDTRIYAYAVDSEMNTSSVVYADYTIKTVAQPSFSPGAGAVGIGSSVTITAGANGDKVAYTTDGTDPVAANAVASPVAVTMDAAKTIKAITVYDANNYSTVATAAYTLTAPSAPTFSPAAGAVSAGTQVTITAASGCQLKYTTDGTDPSLATAVSSPATVTINAATTIRAISYYDANTQSSEASASYTIRQAGANDFELVTSDDELEVNGEYIIVSNTSTPYGFGAISNSKGQNSTAFTISGTTITLNDNSDVQVWTASASGVTSFPWTLTNASNRALGVSGSSSTNVGYDNNTAWALTVGSDNVTTFVNSNGGTRKLVYRASTYNVFGFYSNPNLSGGEYYGVRLYKRVTAGNTITVTQPTGGTISANKNKATAGATITLTAIPDSGYEFDGWTVTGNTSGNAVTVTNNQFTMPNEPVTVTATFARVYTITVTQPAAGGTISADVQTARQGATVTLSATLYTDYELISWNVTDGNNNPVTVDANNQFTMPASNVTVTATVAQPNNWTVYVHNEAEPNTAPKLYAWYTANGTNHELNGAWSGTTMSSSETLADAKKWWKATFTAPSLKVIVNSDGNNQTADIEVTGGNTVYIVYKKNESTQGNRAVVTYTAPEAAKMYIFGAVNGGDWAANEGIEMTFDASSENYTGTYYFTGEGSGELAGYSTFGFADAMASSAEDWNGITNRRGPTAGDRTDASQNGALGTNSNAFKILGGVYTVAVNKDKNQVTVTRLDNLTFSPSSGEVEVGSTTTVSSNLYELLHAINSNITENDVTIGTSTDGGSTYTGANPYEFTSADVGTKTVYAQASYAGIKTQGNATFTVSALVPKYFERVTSIAELNTAIQHNKKIILVDEDHKTALGNGVVDPRMFNRSIVVPVGGGEAVVTSNLGVGEFTIASATGGYTIQYPDSKYMSVTASNTGLTSTDDALVWQISFGEDFAAEIVGTPIGSSDSRHIRGYNGGTSGTGYNFRTYLTTNTTNGHAVFIYAESEESDHTITHDVTSGSSSGRLDSRTTADAGTTVDVIAIPADGYVLTSLSYSYVGGTEQAIPFESCTIQDPEATSTSRIPAYSGSFTMPAANVVIHATFAAAYSVTVDSSISNGTVTVDKALAAENETVTITATPRSNYVVDAVSVTYGDNQSITPTDNGDGTYSFTMPADDVMVSATFTQVVSSYNLTVVSPHATVTGLTSGTYAPGTLFEFTVTPASGYHLVGVNTTFNGQVAVLTPADSTYSFNMQGRDGTVNVICREDVAGQEFKLIESSEDIAAGYRYVLINNETNALAVNALLNYENPATSANNDFSVDSNHVATVTNAVTVITLEAGSATGQFKIKEGDKYLAHDGATLKSVDAVDAQEWTVSLVNDGVVQITNVADNYMIRFNSGYFRCYNSQSGTNSALYREYSSSLAEPVFSLPGGTYSNTSEQYPYNLTLTCATPGATIYYAVGSGAFQEYTTPIVISATQTIRAYSVLGAYRSSTVSQIYIIGNTSGERWERITSSDELIEGQKYIVVYEDHTHAAGSQVHHVMGSIAVGQTGNYREYADTGVTFDLDNHYAYVPQTAGAVELTLGSLGNTQVTYTVNEEVEDPETGEITITPVQSTETKTAYSFQLASGDYIALNVSNNNPSQVEVPTVDSSAKWTIEFTNTKSRGIVAEIGNVAHSDRFFRNNAGASRFNAYMKNFAGFVQLYRKAAAVDAPTFSPVEGLYEESTFEGVQISCSTPSSTIYYTTDGSMPRITVSGTTVTPATGTLQYNGTISLSGNGDHVIRAIATASGVVDNNGDLIVSNVASAHYTLAPNHTQVARDFVKVKEQSTLADGKEVIFVYEAGQFVMGQHNGSVGSQQTREKAAATVLPLCSDENGYSTLDQDYPTDGSPAVFTLKAVTVNDSTYYAFKQKTARSDAGYGKYLAFASASAGAKFGPMAEVADADLATTDNVLFTIAIDGDGVATVSPKNSANRVIRYSSASNTQKFGYYVATSTAHSVNLYWREPLTLGFYPASGSTIALGETLVITPSSNRTIEYTLDGGTTWTTYSGPITLDTEGTVNITARATYNDGENDDPYFITDEEEGTFTVESNEFALSTKLVPGKKYIIVNETAGKALSGSGKSANDVTITNHKTSVGSNVNIYYLREVEVSGDTYYKFECADDNTKFLTGADGAQALKGKADATDDGYQEWSIDFNGTDAILTTNGTGNRSIYYYSNDFRLYNSSQSGAEPIQLYKEYDPTEVDAPEFTPASGSYTEAINVTIASSTDGATVYYTTGNDTYPDGTWTAFDSSNPIALSTNGTYTYRAVAVKQVDGTDYVSEVSSATYTIAIQEASNTDFHLATSLSQLADGMEVIIVNQSDKNNKPYALATKQSNNFYGSDGLTLSGVNNETASLTTGSTVSVLTLGKYVENNDTTFSFYFDDGTNSGYLRPRPTSQNGLILTDVESEGKAVLTPGDNGVMGVVFNTGSRTVLQFNVNGSNDAIFACYSTASQKDVYIYYREKSTMTLAQIEETGTKGNTYTVSNALLGVKAQDNLLWCKDLGNQSLNASEIVDGQRDYMREVITTGGQTGDWDQSNWVCIEFDTKTNSNVNVNSIASSAEGMIIAAGTITAKYVDDVNYSLRIEDTPSDIFAEKLSEPETVFTPNVYCPANFVADNWNLGEAHGVTGPSGRSYFFMNPKVQEVCTFTFGEWNASANRFELPASVREMYNMRAVVAVDWAIQAEQALQDGEAYSFTGVVRMPVTSPNSARRNAPSNIPDDGAMRIAPIDVEANNPITGIEGIFFNNGKTVKSIKYVNVSGIVSDKPFEGVNIVVREYTDGSRSTTKVIR